MPNIYKMSVTIYLISNIVTKHVEYFIYEKKKFKLKKNLI